MPVHSILGYKTNLGLYCEEWFKPLFLFRRQGKTSEKGYSNYVCEIAQNQKAYIRLFKILSTHDGVCT